MKNTEKNQQQTVKCKKLHENSAMNEGNNELRLRQTGKFFMFLKIKNMRK